MTLRATGTLLGFVFGHLRRTSGPTLPAGWTSSVHGDGWFVAHPAGLILGSADFLGATMAALVPEDGGTPIYLVFLPSTNTTSGRARLGLAEVGAGRLLTDASTEDMVDVVLDIGGGAVAAHVYEWSGRTVAGAWSIYDPETEDVEAGRAVLRRIVASMKATSPARP